RQLRGLAERRQDHAHRDHGQPRLGGAGQPAECQPADPAGHAGAGGHVQAKVGGPGDQERGRPPSDPVPVTPPETDQRVAGPAPPISSNASVAAGTVPRTAPANSSMRPKTGPRFPPAPISPAANTSTARVTTATVTTITADSPSPRSAAGIPRTSGSSADGRV